MSFKNHYEVLGVTNKATQDEIKAAFRKLSFQHHPDVNEHADGEIFKAISNSHSVLSNPVQRRRYDQQLLDQSFWRNGHPPTGQGGEWYGDNFHNRTARRRGASQKQAMHVVMETLQNPRYFLYSIVGFGSAFVLSFLLGAIPSPERQYHESPKVEAWKNPTTGLWEQPAPWDPLYRQLKPELELVPREKVRRRHM